MKAPDIPETEIGRQNTLNFLSILDTEEEERFKRLTRISKKAFSVPIALVTLVDANRQWFKSCIGLDVLQTPRNISFCGHAILKDELLVIPDAHDDERFYDNPLVVGPPYIRFYAGYPLTVLNSRIGTLCIIDTEPRTIDQEDEIVIRDLAKMVEVELMALQMSTVDDLTQILNRRGLVTLIQSGLSLCSRQGVFSTLIFFDIDKFKQINDTFGHEEGDSALKTFSQYMTAASRSSDIGGRLGGDEFVIWLSNATAESAKKYLEKLAVLVKNHNITLAKKYSIAFSYGIVQVDPRDTKSIDALLKDADRAMYKNKKAKV